MKLLDIIKESKNIGDVYHFTSPRGILGILDSNWLKPSGAGFGGEFVSTTRDRNFVNAKRYEDKSITGHIFRITLDGNKLSARYKTIPYDDRYNINDREVARDHPMGDEMEQRWFTTNGISGIRNYIKSIAMSKKYLTDTFKFKEEFSRMIFSEKEKFKSMTGYNPSEIAPGKYNPITLANNIMKYFKEHYNIELELIW